MSAPAAINEFGSALDLVDEPSTSSVVQCETFTFKGQREKRESKKYDRSVTFVDYANPTAMMSFKGYILGSGLAVQEAGTEVTSLSNFAATRHGCDPAVGTMIYEDPEDSFSLTDDVQISFNVMWYPFV